MAIRKINHNLSMYYQTYGDADKPALVLLHSGGMAGIEWQPQITPLSQQFQLLIPDLPGHGQSILSEGSELSIAMMAQAVVELLKNENRQKAHILGSSMGGAVALWIALHYPEIVNKLVVYRIGYSKNDDTYSQTQAMANPDYWQQYGLHNWLSKLHYPQGGEAAWEGVITNVSKVLHPDTSDHQHTSSDLQRIQAQTLLIAGDSDPLIPLPMLLEMKTAISQCALWVMPNATHITATNTWRAAAFAEEVSRFLRANNTN